MRFFIDKLEFIQNRVRINMYLSEADTRAKLIDPALHRCGWTEDLIRREETEKGIYVVDGKPQRRKKGRIDYLLRMILNLLIKLLMLVISWA